MRVASGGIPEIAEPLGRPPVSLVFGAMLLRDFIVLRRELGSFLLRVAVQPLFMLFIFGRIAPELGYATLGYAQLLFPGLLALFTVMTSMQGIAAPLMVEFGYTREIEDRILAPLPATVVGLQKIVFATVTSIGAAVLMFPIGILVLGAVPWRAAGLPVLIPVLLLGAVTGAGLGLLMGAAVPPDKIGLMLTLVFPALLFTGASQYPWPGLHHLLWFQVLTAANPITYVSEGSRAALVPGIDHIPVPISIAVLLAVTAVVTVLGCLAFRKRAAE
jgi:ABC-2 type transport system permease protein